MPDPTLGRPVGHDDALTLPQGRCIVWHTDTGDCWITVPNDLFPGTHIDADEPLPGEIDDHYTDRIAMAFLSYMQEWAVRAKELNTNKRPGEPLEPYPPTLTRMPDVAPNDFPQDRTYREAWWYAGSGIYEDVNKAVLIHEKRMMQARKKLISNYRDEMERCEYLDDAAGLKAAKEKMKQLYLLEKTLPDILKECQTIDDLKKITLDSLLSANDGPIR